MKLVPLGDKIVLKQLETEETTKFIKEVISKYEPKIDKLMNKYMENMADGMFCNLDNPNRPLFSEETARKIMSHMNEKQIEGAKNDV